MYAYRNQSILSRFLNIQQPVFMINMEESDGKEEIMVSYQFEQGTLFSARVRERKHGELFPSKFASFQFPSGAAVDRRDHLFHYIDRHIDDVSSDSQVIDSNEWGIVKSHYKGTPGYRDEQDTEYTYDSYGRIVMQKVYDLYPRREVCQECLFEYDERGNVIRYKLRSDLGREEITLKYVKFDSHGNWTHRIAFHGAETIPYHAWREIIYSNDHRRIEQVKRWMEGIPPIPSIDEMPRGEETIADYIECGEIDMLQDVPVCPSILDPDDSELPF